ncbi:hypothetical protein D3C72_919270 [compost metagenome]
MRKERISAMNNKHRDDHTWMKTNKWQNAPKSSSNYGLKSSNSGCGGKIKFFTMMMNNMGSPEKIDFMT